MKDASRRCEYWALGSWTLGFAVLFPYCHNSTGPSLGDRPRSVGSVQSIFFSGFPLSGIAKPGSPPWEAISGSRRDPISAFRCQIHRLSLSPLHTLLSAKAQITHRSPLRPSLSFFPLLYFI